MKVYDDRAGPKVLRHHGPIVGVEKAGAGQTRTLAVSAADPSWILQRRLIGKMVAGVSFGSAVAPVDRGDVMGQVIDALNAGSVGIGTSAGDTGIRRGNIVASASSFFGPWRYYRASAAFTDLAAGLDAPDWDLRPVEPTKDATGIQIAALDVSPAFGTLRGDVVFEMGTGRRNVDPATLRDVLDAGGETNDAVHLPQGFPDNATQVALEEIDQTSIDDRGRLEDVIAADVQTDDFRRRLLQEHVRIRKQPRRVITFSPIRDVDPDLVDLVERRVPRPFIDYDVGDVVRFRAVEPIDVADAAGTITGQRYVTTVDAYFRVFSIEVVVDDVGAETVILTFVEEG